MLYSPVLSDLVGNSEDRVSLDGNLFICRQRSGCRDAQTDMRLISLSRIDLKCEFSHDEAQTDYLLSCTYLAHSQKELHI